MAFSGSPNSGARIVFNGGTAQVGGTSLSAPIFAGLWARVLAQKGTNVGFAAPLLYALPASDFHDITVGNNNGVSAGPGYDLVTGRGSLIMSNAIQHIGAPAGNVAPVAYHFRFERDLYRYVHRSDGTSLRAVGTSVMVRRVSRNVAHLYGAGTFNVTLTVTDNGGLTGSKPPP